MKYAVVNNSNIVENIVIWDTDSDWKPCHSDDILVVIEDGVSVSIGFSMNQDGTFSSNIPVTEDIP